MSDAAAAKDGPAPRPAGAASAIPLSAIIAAYVAAVLGAAAAVERGIVPHLQSGASPPPAADVGHAAAKRDKRGGHGGGHDGVAGAAAGGTFTVEDLVVNPADCGGLRYLAATVALQSPLPGFAEDMKANEPRVKDALIRILGSKTVDELADVAQREVMRREIHAELRRIVPEQEIDAVYFMRFVLQ